MLELVKEVVIGILYGMRDAVVGVFKIYHINKELQTMDETKAREQRSQEPSSLARRRAQRHKTDPILSQIRR